MPIKLGDLAGGPVSPLPPDNLHVFPPPQETQARLLKKTEEVFSKWMHLPNNNDPEPLEVLLGTVAANYLSDAPVWLMLTGPTSGGKTELLRTLSLLPHVHKKAHMTEAGMMGGKLNQEGVMELNSGVLHDIGNFGFIVIQEFSGILAADPHQQPLILSILRQAYDGEVSRDIGSEEGSRKLHWRGHCAVIAGCGSIIDSKRHVIAEMGERFIYYRLEYAKSDRMLALRRASNNRRRGGKQFKVQMRKELSEAVNELLKPVIDNPPEIRLSTEESEYIAMLSDFASSGRTVIDRSGAWSKEAESVHAPEMGIRASEELEGLVCGLLAIGVEYARIWEILKRIAWHSIPDMRVRVLRYLLGKTEPGGGYCAKTAQRIADELNQPAVAIKRALEDLVLLGVVEPFLRQDATNTAPQEGGKRAGGRPKALWKVSQETWANYAGMEYPPLKDPRRGLLGAATTGEDKAK